MKLSPKEEILIRLIRLLDPEQQPDLIGRCSADVRAQLRANGVSTAMLNGSKLRVIGNARVEQALGLPLRIPLRKPPKKVVVKRPEKDDPDLDPGMDDALG